LVSEEYHEETILRQVSSFTEVFGSTEPEVVSEKYWEKVDTGLSLKREAERSERRKGELIGTLEGLRGELEEEKGRLEGMLRDKTVEQIQHSSHEKLSTLFTNVSLTQETRLKDTNQVLIQVVFGLMTSLSKLTSRDQYAELGPHLSFSASIDSSQLGKLTETAEMMDELPRLMLIIGKKFTTAREIAYQRRCIRSAATRVVVRSQKPKKMLFSESPVARLKQEFESLVQPSLPIANVEPSRRNALPSAPQEVFPPQLLPHQSKLNPSQSLNKLKAHSSSPRRSGSLTERPAPSSRAQLFTRTLISINKDISLLTSKQLHTPKNAQSFTEMIANLHKRQFKLSSFRTREPTEPSTIETSRGRPGFTPLSKTSSLSPFHPTYRPRIPLKLPLFP
jgi:hypothetical protein